MLRSLSLSLLCGIVLIVLIWQSCVKPNSDDPVLTPTTITIFHDAKGIDTLTSDDTLSDGELLVCGVKLDNYRYLRRIDIALIDSLGKQLFFLSWDSTNLLKKSTIDSIQDNLTNKPLSREVYRLREPGHRILLVDVIQYDTLFSKRVSFFVAPQSAKIGLRKIFQTPPFGVVGLPLSLYASIRGSRPVGVRWYKNDTSLVRAITLLDTLPDDTLRFATLLFSDTGAYRCVCNNGWGVDTSLRYHISLDHSDKPPLILNNKTMNHTGSSKKDSALFLSVTVQGALPMTYTWFRDHFLLDGFKDSVLQLPRLSFVDEGVYRCVVTNRFGADSSAWDTVRRDNRAPECLKEIIQNSVLEGKTFQLSMDGFCIDRDNDSIEFLLLPNGELDDTIIGGNLYECVAGFQDSGLHIVTMLGSDSRLWDTLRLRLNIHNVNRKPRFQDTLPKKSYRIDEGELLSIRFKAEDPDADTLFYFLGPTSLPQDPLLNQTVALTDSTLVWRASGNDSGVYTAIVAVSDRWSSDSALITIGVGNANLPPQIVLSMANPGDTLRIHEMQQCSTTVKVIDPNREDRPVLLRPANLPPKSLFDTATGHFSFTPDFSLSTGTTQAFFRALTFYACDNNSGAPRYDTCIIHCVVIDSNSAPFWKKSAYTLFGREAMMVTFPMDSIYGGDHESDSVTFAATIGAIDPVSRLFTWRPGFTDNGSRIFLVTATDNHQPPALSRCTLSIHVVDSIQPSVLYRPDSCGYNRMRLHWSRSVEPEFGAYRLYRDTVLPVTQASVLVKTTPTIDDTTAVVTGLREQTRYYFRLFCINSHGTIAESNVVDSLTPPLEPPQLTVTAPVIVRDSAFIRQESPLLTGSVSSLAAIRLMQIVIGSDTQQIAVTGSSWRYTLGGSVSPKVWHRVSLIAQDNEAKTTIRQFWLYLKPTLRAHLAPIDTAAVTNRSIRLRWPSLPFCERYCLYRAASTAPAQFLMVADLADTLYHDSLLALNSFYRYQVRGYYRPIGGFSESDTTVASPLAVLRTKNYFIHRFHRADESLLAGVVTSDSGYCGVGRLAATGAAADVFVIRYAARGDTLWTTTFGNQREDIGCAILQTSDRGFIITGTTETIDRDVYLLKIGSGGARSWHVAIDNAIDQAHGIAVAPNGDYLIAGATQTVGHPTDGLFMRRDNDGDSRWTVRFGIDSTADCGYAVLRCSDGQFAVAGFTASTGIDGDAWLVKYNTSGDTVWSRNYGGAGYQTARGLTQTRDNGFVLAGYSSVNDSDILVIKTADNGTQQWSRTYGGSGIDRAFSVCRTNDGNIVVCGETASHGAGSSDIYLMKIDVANGDTLWTRTFGTTAAETAASVAPAPDGGYCIFGTAHTQETGADAYIIKTDGSGFALP